MGSNVEGWFRDDDGTHAPGRGGSERHKGMRGRGRGAESLKGADKQILSEIERERLSEKEKNWQT